MGSLTLLNQSGDFTIMWEPEQDAAMEAIIEKKMAEGITFFVLEPSSHPMRPPRRHEYENFEQAAQHRAVVIADEDLEAFVGAGKGELVKTPTAARAGRKTTKAKTAKEAAKGETVAVKQRKGG